MTTAYESDVWSTAAGTTASDCSSQYRRWADQQQQQQTYDNLARQFTQQHVAQQELTPKCRLPECRERILTNPADEGYCPTHASNLRSWIGVPTK